MRLRRTFIALLASCALAVGLSAVPAGAQVSGPTLADILESQGGGTDSNWYDYDILAAGVQAAGLSGALDDPNADLTVFIPNDRAFQALVADQFGWLYWWADEATILDKVVEIETAAPGTLQTVILYHAVPGQITSEQALSVRRGTELTTLQGGTIRVKPAWRTAFIVDQDRNDKNPWLIPSQLDIQASNGIAHGISLVLRPVDL